MFRSKKLVLPILAIGLISANAFGGKDVPNNKPGREQIEALYNPAKWTLRDIALATVCYYAVYKTTDQLLSQPQTLEAQSIPFATTMWGIKAIATLSYCWAVSEFLRDTWNSGVTL